MVTRCGSRGIAGWISPNELEAELLIRAIRTAIHDRDR